MPDVTMMHAERLVALHREMAPLDEGDGNTLAVRLYHMLMDLRRMATLHGIAFDDTVRQTAADYEDVYGEEAA